MLIGNGSEVHPEEIDVTFDDVKGVEEAKQELQEVVEFLKNPEKFSALGGKLPKVCFTYRFCTCRNEHSTLCAGCALGRPAGHWQDITGASGGWRSR